MKSTLTILVLSLMTCTLFSQILESEVNPDGIIFPRMDTNTRDALSPIQGQCIYNTDSESIHCYDGTAWIDQTSIPNLICDIDNDTKVHVEKFNDSDVIHFDAEGTEIYSFSRTISGDSRLEPRPQNDLGALYNLIIGVEAGQSTTIGGNNTFLGGESGALNDRGRDNSFIGTFAGRDNQTGSSNTFVGVNSGKENNGGQNTFIGVNAGESNSGDFNVSIGVAAGESNSGSENVMMGFAAGEVNMTGRLNTYIGANSATEYSGGDFNTFVGAGTGEDGSTGGHNAFFGYNSGEHNTGRMNTFIGSQSGNENRTGENNTYVGGTSGNDATGNLNTFIGSGAGATSTSSSSVFIGTDAGFRENNDSQLIIETALEQTPDHNYPLIHGDFDDNFLKVNGVLHISEVAKLQPLTTAPVCSPTTNHGGLYFNGTTNQLNLCIINASGQGQWVPLN